VLQIYEGASKHRVRQSFARMLTAIVAAIFLMYFVWVVQFNLFFDRERCA
jgi:multidrug efflux pump subunit AcrB